MRPRRRYEASNLLSLTTSAMGVSGMCMTSHSSNSEDSNSFLVSHEPAASSLLWSRLLSNSAVYSYSSQYTFSRLNKKQGHTHTQRKKKDCQLRPTAVNLRYSHSLRPFNRSSFSSLIRITFIFFVPSTYGGFPWMAPSR
jgi:hypothetical protein